MDNELQAYKKFIDGLIGYKGSLFYKLQAFSSGEWTNEDAQKLYALPADIQEAIRAVMTSAAHGAIHDLLAYLAEGDVELVVDGLKLPKEPYGTTLFQDWALRVQGLDWYDEEA